jgi:hypothetical protein
MRLLSAASDTIAPDGGEDVVLRDQSLTVLHQESQQVEHLRLNMHRLFAEP